MLKQLLTAASVVLPVAACTQGAKPEIHDVTLIEGGKTGYLGFNDAQGKPYHIAADALLKVATPGPAPAEPGTIMHFIPEALPAPVTIEKFGAEGPETPRV